MFFFFHVCWSQSPLQTDASLYMCISWGEWARFKKAFGKTEADEIGNTYGGRGSRHKQHQGGTEGRNYWSMAADEGKAQQQWPCRAWEADWGAPWHFSPAGDKKVQMEMGPHPELTLLLYFTSWCLLWLGYGVEDKRTEDQGEQNVTASFCQARRIKIWT